MAQPTPLTPVRLRLDNALVSYLETTEPDDISDVTIEAVAAAAGVSRATAYRHFGDRDGLLTQAAVALTRRHADRARRAMTSTPTIAAHVEEGLAYTAREINGDRLLRLLMAGGRSPAVDSVVRDIMRDISGQAMLAAQRDGQLRDDLSIEQINSWLLEQTYVMIRLRLDEAAARIWVRRFVIPALRPQQLNASSMAEPNAVFAEISRRVKELDALLDGARSIL